MIILDEVFSIYKVLKNCANLTYVFTSSSVCLKVCSFSVFYLLDIVVFKFNFNAVNVFGCLSFK